MSHYRSMRVDNIDYKIAIGKRFVEIRPEEGKKIIVPKTDIGVSPKSNSNNVIVTPKMISDYLQGINRPDIDYFDQCLCQDAEKTIGVDPFDSEILGRTRYVAWCEDCYTNRAGDI